MSTAEASTIAALGRFLVDQRSSYLAFGLAFVLLWSVWRRHHQLMDQIRVLSRTFASWHAPFLLLVAFLPFPTAVIGSALTNPMAQTLFAGTMAGIVFCEVALKEVSADGLVIGDAAQARRHADASWAVGFWFVLSLGLAWVFSYAYVLWIIAPVAAGYGGPLISRLRARRNDPHDEETSPNGSYSEHAGCPILRTPRTVRIQCAPLSGRRRAHVLLSMLQAHIFPVAMRLRSVLKSALTASGVFSGGNRGLMGWRSRGRSWERRVL
ncbi:TMEM175 family protein [Streptomyces sp. NPDC051665]|uniref:TMEM175 family protein n=1 Tax=Streptomyces sp. NPDC051665 TaxID=3154647 RepID=UPI003447366E